MKLSRFRFVPVVSCLLVGIASGCQQKQSLAQAAGSAPQSIPVSHPVQREVTDFVDFTGQTDAVKAVSVRARVTGYLLEMEQPFKEGAEVDKGALLFEIDPAPYQAVVDQAHSQVQINEAQQRLAKITYERDRSLGSSTAISQQQLDQDKAALDAGEARTKAAEAALKAANINLGFTHVTAPISGRISRIFYTSGNLVTADQTLLTTIVSMDPMYVYFNIDQRTYDRYNTAKNESADKASKNDKDGKDAKETLDVAMEMENEVGFPWKGHIDFINNQVNPSTGTIAVRGVFKNKRTNSGTWRLVPGMFVRIRLSIGEPQPALLVIDRAIGSDQGLKFVYVMDEEKKVQYRRVKTGALQTDGLRVIEPYTETINAQTKEVVKEGLKRSDWVVVGGLPQLRPRTEITPEEVKMPFLTVAEADSATAPSTTRPQPPPPTGKKK